MLWPAIAGHLFITDNILRVTVSYYCPLLNPHDTL